MSYVRMYIDAHMHYSILPVAVMLASSTCTEIFTDADLLRFSATCAVLFSLTSYIACSNDTVVTIECN